MSLGITPAHFADPVAYELFTFILKAEAEGRPFDFVSIGAVLPRDLLVPLLEIEENAPISMNVEYFAQEVKAAHWQRRVEESLTALHREIAVRNAYDPIEPFQQKILSLVEEVSLRQADKIADASQLAEKAMANLEERIERQAKGETYGMATGFTVLDKLTHGFLPGGLYALAARMKAGKTTFAANICANIAALGHSSAFFTVEMADVEIADKMITSLGRLRVANYLSGKLSAEEIDQVHTAADKFSKLPIVIRDVKEPYIERLLFDLRRLKRTRNIKFAVVDYVQQFSSEKKSASRVYELSYITSQLKLVARELQIAILAIAQLNRKAEESDEPSSSHIRDSDAFAADADAVMLLWQDAGRHVVNLSLNRRGDTGKFFLEADLSRGHFGNPRGHQ
jgi:replicative DNA helicase